ncbi:MAG: SRPBCC family protein [Geminicoccaceae bacterium]
MDEFGVVTAARTVRLQRVLPGPIERVWAYLTESEKRAKWLAAGPMELRVGGPVELHFANSELTPHGETAPERYKDQGCATLHGRITRCDPPRLLSHSWGDGGSEVTFELTPQGEDVLLVLTHRRLPDRRTMVSVASGWHAHLGILIDRLSGREPPPFWSTHARLEAEYETRIPAA